MLARCGPLLGCCETCGSSCVILNCLIGILSLVVSALLVTRSAPSHRFRKSNFCHSFFPAGFLSMHLSVQLPFLIISRGTFHEWIGGAKLDSRRIIAQSSLTILSDQIATDNSKMSRAFLTRKVNRSSTSIPILLRCFTSGLIETSVFSALGSIRIHANRSVPLYPSLGN